MRTSCIGALEPAPSSHNVIDMVIQGFKRHVTENFEGVVYIPPLAVRVPCRSAAEKMLRSLRLKSLSMALCRLRSKCLLRNHLAVQYREGHKKERHPKRAVRAL